jgi:hypothetical protein
MPDDDPVLVTILLMHLYGFSQEEWAMAAFHRNVVYVCTCIDVHELAKKYMVVDLQEDLEFMVSTGVPGLIKVVGAWLYDIENHRLGWVWDFVGRAEIFGPDTFLNMLLDAIHKNADWIAANVPAQHLQRGLRACPGFATRLLMTGGFDGKGPKFELE